MKTALFAMYLFAASFLVSYTSHRPPKTTTQTTHKAEAEWLVSIARATKFVYTGNRQFQFEKNNSRQQ